MTNVFDATTSPTTEPTQMVAGDYTIWRRTDLGLNYSPTLYSLSYEFRAEITGHKKSLTATSSGTEFSIELLSAASLEWATGVWQWSAYITRLLDSQRVQVDDGVTVVLADKATDNNDPRTLPKKMLAEIERAMLHRATNTQLDTTSYSLGSESSASRDTAQLILHRTYWRRELVTANRRWVTLNGGRNSRSIKVRFK
ncbi:hypothetical protein [uncultured Paraglaciecola sp.]|uniref:hypothetical protein n=1 Tax=uncultured Paraglaciecola sp. TaxID=1765024 RepID=UPI00263359E8|nr:hypothetical protein [uncultured Paraglaciecola sp.]